MMANRDHRAALISALFNLKHATAITPYPLANIFLFTVKWEVGTKNAPDTNFPFYNYHGTLEPFCIQRLLSHSGIAGNEQNSSDKM
jgi:hypothetical protein